MPHFDRRRNENERNERPSNEYYQHNQRIKALIIDVRDPSQQAQGATRTRDGGNRPSIIVSRTHPDLIRRLLELEVPEIYDGVVEVKSVAREAGARSKIAVHSRESNLDPVGACVGPKGSRIRMVVGELRGERMDNSFGSQIRNYVLYPYQMVKDLRSGVETGNVDAVFDGDIDEFVVGYHQWRVSEAG